MFREEQGGVGWAGGMLRLPSSTVIARRVLDVANGPTLSTRELGSAVQGDPALTLALLQAASRAHTDYRADSLTAAIERLGATEALRVCLHFRLLDRRASGDVDYIRLWRHTLLMSGYAGAISQRLRREDCARIQTAAVLCGIGAMTKGWKTKSASTTNAGEATAWLASRHISHNICQLVGRSQTQQMTQSDIDEAAGCIVLARNMADVWLRADWQTIRVQTQSLAQHLFGVIPDFCAWVFGVSGPQAVELESLLHVRYPSRRKIIALYELAKRARASCYRVIPATGVAGGKTAGGRDVHGDK